MRSKAFKFGVVLLLLCHLTSMAQQKDKRTLSGMVYDQNGQPVSGVAVLVGDTGKGVTTDISGNFTIEVPDGQTVLRFTSLGYTDETVRITQQQNSIKVYIKEESIGLDETIVVGYGTQKKVNLTGAVSTVSADKLSDRATNSLAHMLQGNVPGLNVTMTSGRPGNEASVNIRGFNSINGGSPLILIDGVEGTLDRVNPNDVESISVIKDASSSAIYGARASFGVILVTTKQGSDTDGKAKFSYSGRFGITAPTTSTEYETRGYYSVYLNDLFMYNYNGNRYTTYTDADMEELWARRNDKVENPERPWTVIDYRNGRDQYVYYANTDWYHYLYQDIKPMQQHNVSFNGGSKKMKYFVSAGYQDQEGQFRQNTDKFTRLDFRSKLSFDVTKWLNFSTNTSFYKSWYTYPGPSGVNTSFSLMTVHALASYPTQNPDGTSLYKTALSSSGSLMDGLLTALDKGMHKNRDDKNQFTTTAEATIKPFEGLEIKGNFTYSFYNYAAYNRFVNTTYSTYPGVVETLSTGSYEDRLSENSTVHNYLQTNIYATYSKSIADAHNIKVMAGFNWETKKLKDINATGYYLLSENLTDLNLTGTDADGNKRTSVSGGQNEYAIEGMFARINYDYKGRYLFEVSGRYDGTSRFASDNRWGFFPSASAAWRISEEPFFSPVKDWFNNLKIRYSFGRLGNQQVGYYDYIRKISLSTQSYLFGGSTKPVTASIGAPVAGNLTWEVAQHQNLGLDMSFLKNRLDFTAEAYIRDTKDMLTDGVALPSVYGASAPKMNAADLRTKGYELSVTWKDMFVLAGRPFHYNITANFYDYITKITKYANPDRTFAKSYYEGMTLGEIWGYKIGGLFQSDEEAAAYTVNQSSVNASVASNGLHGGELKFLDLDGDGKISLGQNTVDDPGDRRIIGNSKPRYNYGLTIGFSWYNFDFSTFIQGIGKMDWYPTANTMAFWGPYARPYAALIPKDFHTMYWTEDNKDAYFPRPCGYIALNANNALSTVNDRYLQNIGYCRLKNLTIGYTLPKKWMEKINMDGLRIYFSGENLGYLSSLKSDYIDPELAATTASSTLRVYPWQKTFVFGIDIKF